MRICLIYPPPFKIPPRGQPPLPEPAAATPDFAREHLIDSADFLSIPQGLLSIGAQAKRAGHDVRIVNLAHFPWDDVTLLLGKLRAEVYGFSCMTANRHGVAMCVEFLREAHPAAHIVVGGPHVSAMPRQVLERWPAVDTVVIGEGEATFIELVARLAEGRSVAGTPGTASRAEDGGIVLGPPRPSIADLDTLESPLDHYVSHILVTARGCPGECTFCGSQAMWGRKVRAHSPGYVLDMLDRAVNRHGVVRLAIKDETFTAMRGRALAICQGVVERGLRFLWSCDTRVDRLDDDVLVAMRRAGCVRISLGVESGAPEVLASLRKRVTPEAVVEATGRARRFGFEVRAYIIGGNRLDSSETLAQTRRLLDEARPTGVGHSVLAIYPGTEEFELLRAASGVDESVFFDRGFAEPYFFRMEPGGHERAQRIDLTGFCALERHQAPYTVDERRGIAERLPEVPAVHLELATALLEAGEPDEAVSCLRRAEALGYPCRAALRNQEACAALQRGELPRAESLLNEAAAAPDCPRTIHDNALAFRAWRARGGPERSEPFALTVSAGFEMGPAGAKQPAWPAPIRIADRHGNERILMGNPFGAGGGGG